MRFARQLGSFEVPAPSWRASYVLVPVLAATALGVFYRLRQRRRELDEQRNSDDWLAEIIRQSQPALERARSLAVQY